MSTKLIEAARIRPYHQDLTDFFQSIFPSHPRDVSLLYHVPRNPGYDPAMSPANDIILSITPTSGVYSKLTNCSPSWRPGTSTKWQRMPRPVCFLHRPFNLDRRAVPKGALVLSSHKRFDELLTVGWNVALAEHLGLDVDGAVCVQGYKGDPDRRIGLVARLRQGGTKTLENLRAGVLKEFAAGELHVGHPPEPQKSSIEVEAVSKASSNNKPDADGDIEIAAVAIMNAFGPDEIARAVTCATQSGFISDDEGHKNLLYLTGEAKPAGLAALNETYHGMSAVCVGHRAAEEWGIKYLAESIRQRWPEINIHTVLEEEEPPPKRTADGQAKSKSGREKKPKIDPEIEMVQ